MKCKLIGFRRLLATLMLMVSIAAYAQVDVKGIVTDQTGEPVIGATVREKGNARNGTATDIEGGFNLKVSSINATLEVSYVGMESKSEKLNGRSFVNITLEEN